jgi:hypothetical protein
MVFKYQHPATYLRAPAAGDPCNKVGSENISLVSGVLKTLNQLASLQHSTLVKAGLGMSSAWRAPLRVDGIKRQL